MDASSGSRPVTVYVDLVGDLFHAGHVALLEAARAHGDRLVVGVLGDAAVASYKRTPVMTLDERVAVVAACRHVDVVVSDAPLRPSAAFLAAHGVDVVVHGDDLAPEVAADVYGAAPRLVLVPRAAGLSTTSVLARIEARSPDAIAPPERERRRVEGRRAERWLVTAGGEAFEVARAREEDVPALVALLADDPLGATREVADPGALDAYGAALRAIDADPAHLLAVVRDARARIVGTLQLTLLPGLTRGGTTRLQVEGVRLAASARGGGLGSALLAWAHAWGREHGAILAQLTSDLARVDARRFYERAGYVPSHVGLKRPL